MTVSKRITLAASFVGLMLNLLLVFLKFSDKAGGIVGCGGAVGCDSVLSSRWSEVFGVPLPTLGAILYLVLIAALVRKWGWLEWFGFGAIAATAVWLVVVQAVVLRRFCPWCMAAHGVGLVVVFSGVLWASRDRRFPKGFLAGSLAAGLLVIVQVLGPLPDARGVSAISTSVSNMQSDLHAVGSGRKISFDRGRKVFDLDALPHLGPADAEHVLVEYFDFLCPACQRMQDHLSNVMEEYPEKICVIMLPVPLEHGCNASLPEAERGHPGSCEIARVAMAVWRARPDIYPIIHRRFMEHPSLDPAVAMAIAREQVDAATLDTAMRDPWIEQIIQADIADWDRFAGQPKILPQLLLSEGRILHGIPPDRETFMTVMKKELGL